MGAFGGKGELSTCVTLYIGLCLTGVLSSTSRFTQSVVRVNKTKKGSRWVAPIIGKQCDDNAFYSNLTLILFGLSNRNN